MVKKNFKYVYKNLYSCIFYASLMSTTKLLQTEEPYK